MNWYQLYTFAEIGHVKTAKLAAQFNLHPQYVQDVASIDPSDNGKYTPWLLKHRSIVDSQIGRGKVADDLKKFHENTPHNIDPSYRDLIGKHTPHGLSNAVMHLSNDKLPKHLPAGSELEHKSGPYHMVRINTPEASRSLCKDSGWCIGDSDTAHAKHLLAKGPLHVIYKHGKRFAGVHAETGEFQTHKENKLHSVIDRKDVLSHWPQAKMRAASSPERALNFAKTMGARFPEGEDMIATHAHAAADYGYHLAKHGLANRFEKGEPEIAKYHDSALYYAQYTLGKPFPLGEPAIATSPMASLNYARNVKKGRFELGEPAINRDNYTKTKYEYHLANPKVHTKFPE